METLIVIPARMGSSRFPGKPLTMVHGRTMLERVWRIASACKTKVTVVIATDDERVQQTVRGFGARSVLTAESCRTGTDRAAQAYERLSQEFEVVVSLQADAVLTPPWVLDSLLEAMTDDSKVNIATPAVRLRGELLAQFLSRKAAGSTTGTTVVVSSSGDALYFSKSVLPAARNQSERQSVLQHIGIYAYRTPVLRAVTALPEGDLERIEKLEQLRALEAGIPIRVVEVDYRGRTHGSVDNPEDVALIESIIDREGELVP